MNTGSSTVAARKSSKPAAQRHPTGKTSPKRINAQERMRQAWELRKAGVSYEDIAERLNYSSRSAAYKAVKSVMDRVTTETGKELRTLHTERLNTMLMVAWREVQQGDLRAIDVAMRIMERQAAMGGIDAPVQTVQHNHVMVVGGSESDYIKALQEAAKAQAELEAGPVGDDDYIDAEIVDDD